VLRDERREYAGLACVDAGLREEVARAEADAVAEEQHRHAGAAGRDLADEHVEVGARALYVVLRLDALERGDLVAQARRLLELDRAARRLHRATEFLDDLAALAVEEHGRVAHAVAILRDADEADARRAAALDLVLQARPRAVAEVAVLALAHEKQLLHQIE